MLDMDQVMVLSIPGARQSSSRPTTVDQMKEDWLSSEVDTITTRKLRSPQTATVSSNKSLYLHTSRIVTGLCEVTQAVPASHYCRLLRTRASVDNTLLVSQANPVSPRDNIRVQYLVAGYAVMSINAGQYDVSTVELSMQPACYINMTLPVRLFQLVNVSEPGHQYLTAE